MGEKIESSCSVCPFTTASLTASGRSSEALMSGCRTRWSRMHQLCIRRLYWRAYDEMWTRHYTRTDCRLHFGRTIRVGSKPMTWVVWNSTTQAFENLGHLAAGGGSKSRRNAFVRFTTHSPGLGVALRSYAREPAWQHEQHPPSSSGLVQGRRMFARVSGQ